MSSTAAEPGRPVTARPAAATGEEVLERAGYKPELRRSLRFFSMFAIAFSIISITTGIFLNYGFGLAYWGPASIWTWPIVGVCNMMIALVVAELGTRIPLAGYAYQWSARLVNPTYGWFVGFAGLLYMAVGGGAIMLEVASPLLLSEFNVNNPSPRLVLAVAVILMLLPVVINIISIQVAARVNNVAVFTEIIGTVLFGVLLLILWGVHAKPTRCSWRSWCSRCSRSWSLAPAPRPGWSSRCRGTTCCRSPASCGRSTCAARPRSSPCWSSA
jgi:amino acid permease